MRDFNALPRWHPRIRESRIENGEPVRPRRLRARLPPAERRPLREKLLGLSDYDMFCTYAILESPMPLTDYVATLRLTPVSDGNRTFVDGRPSSTAPRTAADDLVERHRHQRLPGRLRRAQAPLRRRDAMVKIVKSTIIEAPVEAVWAVLRDFNGHDQWHPAVADSHIERGLTSDRVGCVRRFHLADGSELREQLLTLPTSTWPSATACWRRRSRC